MGADVYFYIQKKNNKGDWENLTLYKGNGEEVTLYRRGYEAWNYIKEEFSHDMTDEEIGRFVTEKPLWEYDEQLPWYTATYSLIKYLPYVEVYDSTDVPEEYEDKKQFWTYLKKDMDNFIYLLDEEYTHSDRLRLVALVSY